MPACARPGVYVPRQTHDCDGAVRLPAGGRCSRVACPVCRSTASRVSPEMKLAVRRSIEFQRRAACDDMALWRVCGAGSRHPERAAKLAGAHRRRNRATGGWVDRAGARTRGATLVGDRSSASAPPTPSRATTCCSPSSPVRRRRRATSPPRRATCRTPPTAWPPTRSAPRTPGQTWPACMKVAHFAGCGELRPVIGGDTFALMLEPREVVSSMGDWSHRRDAVTGEPV